MFDEALTLVPDHHICVVRAPEQIVASVPLALPRLDPARPQHIVTVRGLGYKFESVG